MADDKLVFVGLDTTYCVVDEVDTTASTMDDHFLQEAIDDAETTVKEEPADHVATETDNHVIKPHSDLDETTKNIIKALRTKQKELSSSSTFNDCGGESLQNDAEERERTAIETERRLALSNSALLRAALQREPVSLREPENSRLSVSDTRQSPEDSSPQKVEIVDVATGNVLAGPVLKQKAKRKSQQKVSTSNSNSVAVVKKPNAVSGKSENKDKDEEENAEGSKAKRVREKPYQCGVCRRWFGCKSHVVEHMRTHTGEKPFKCPLCDKCFSQKSNIHQHMNTHTQQRPFRCNDCGKDFMYRGSLYKHKRLHTGERPYTCGQCGRRFTHASQLFEHMRTHTNERPFECGVCHRRFAHSGTMHRHQRNHFKVKGKDVKLGKLQPEHKKNEDEDVILVEEENLQESQKFVGDINHNSQPYHSQDQNSGKEKLSQLQQNMNQLSDEISQESSHLLKKSLDQQGELDCTSNEESVTEESVRKGGEERSCASKEKNDESIHKDRKEVNCVSKEENNNCSRDTNSDLHLAVSSAHISTSTTAAENSVKTAESEKMLTHATGSRTSKQRHGSSRKTSKRKKSAAKTAESPRAVSSVLKSGLEPSSDVKDSKSCGQDVKSGLSESPNFVDVGNTSASAPKSASLVMSQVLYSTSVPATNKAQSSDARLGTTCLKNSQNESVSSQSEPSTVDLQVSSQNGNSSLQPSASSSSNSPTTVSTDMDCSQEVKTLPQSSSKASKCSSKRKSSNSVSVQKPKRTRLETPELKVYSCDICSRSFCHKRSVNRHKLASHPEFAAENSEGIPNGEGHNTKNSDGNARNSSGGNAKNSSDGSAGISSEGNPGNSAKMVEEGSSNRNEKETRRNVNRSLLKSLLTLSVIQEKSNVSSACSVPDLTALGIQPLEAEQLGEASASLQAIAQLCSGQAPLETTSNRMSPGQGMCKDTLMPDMRKKLVFKTSQSVFQILGRESDSASDQIIPKIIVKQSREGCEPTLLRISLKQECEDSASIEQLDNSIDENQNLSGKQTSESAFASQNILETPDTDCSAGAISDENQNVSQTSSGSQKAEASFCVKVENCSEDVAESCSYAGMPSANVHGENVDSSLDKGTTYEILEEVTVKLEPQDTDECL